MTGIDDLVRRVAERARSESAELPLPVSGAELDAAEDALGFRLPPLLARLYRDVANGGFGPDYRLLPLAGDGRTVVADYHGKRAGRARGDRPFWPAGVLPMLEWGCAMYAAVDCMSEPSTVLLFEPSAFEGDWTAAWFVDAESLDDWLETWVSGTGWYEEGGIEEGGIEEGEEIEFRAWSDVRERLVRAG